MSPAHPESSLFYIGVDIGTGSARACLINSTGKIYAIESAPISQWSPKPDYYNQSSTNIWRAICHCVKTIVDKALSDALSGLSERSQVAGIGFDATCSLVVLKETDDSPAYVGPFFGDEANQSADEVQDIILWMDHRATTQTDTINATEDPVLRYVGGKMSVEMEIPKALWLKDNMPKGAFEQCKFYDLADFLTHRATGSEARSFCSTVCKQGYVPVGADRDAAEAAGEPCEKVGIDGSIKGWSTEFLTAIGLEELAEDNFRRLGGVDGENGQILSAGTFVGSLTAAAAQELGLTTDCAVGSGIIDAYAGWIGTVAASTKNSATNALTLSQRLAAVAGTSTCHLVMSDTPVFVPGIWGPYRDVLVPGKWLAEGGQSCTGALLSHIVKTHPAYDAAQDKAAEDGLDIFTWLNEHIQGLAEDNSQSVAHYARHYFFYGDLHGNRSPIADSRMRGSVIGLSMNAGIDELALAYYGAVEFIGQQTRHIIDTLNAKGHTVSAIYLSGGGQCRNRLLTSTMAKCTRMPVIIAEYVDAAVVHGAAMLGAKAAAQKISGTEAPLWDIMKAMTQPGTVVEPVDAGLVDYKILDAKYSIFLEMAEQQQRARKLVDDAII